MGLNLLADVLAYLRLIMNLIIVSSTAYNKYINNNKINDCPITKNYIINHFNH